MAISFVPQTEMTSELARVERKQIVGPLVELQPFTRTQAFQVDWLSNPARQGEIHNHITAD